MALLVSFDHERGEVHSSGLQRAADVSRGFVYLWRHEKGFSFQLFNIEFVFIELIAQSMHHCLNDIHAPYFIAAHSRRLRQDDEELIVMIESYAKKNGFL